MCIKFSTFLGLRNPVMNLLNFLNSRMLLSDKPRSYRRACSALPWPFRRIETIKYLVTIGFTGLIQIQFPISIRVYRNMAIHSDVPSALTPSWNRLNRHYGLVLT